MSQRKVLNWAFIFIFMVILTIPSIFINLKKDQVSEIDNRRLAELNAFQGFSWESLNNLARNIEEYYDDRLGFRTQMITLNQIYNDKVFGFLVHPSYEYGKDGYIFSKFEREWTEYDDFINKYTNYIKRMQLYCEERDVDFLFVLNPSKTILYSEFLPDSIHYRFGLYNDLLNQLLEKEINSLDLAVPLLKAKEKMGLQVCNVKYDVGHWNMHGAFYGMSAIMEKLGQNSSGLHSLNPNDFDFKFVKESYLMSTRFAIDEDCPYYSPKITDAVVIEDLNEEIRKGAAYPYFKHYINLQNPDGPKIFVFHGSHLGPKLESQSYIVDQFSEAVFIFSYNIIADLPYYFNIFQPDMVLYEVADRTINYTYVNIDSLENKVLQPEFSKFVELPEAKLYYVEKTNDIENNNEEGRLRKLDFNVKGNNLEYAYLKIEDKVLDFDITATDDLFKISIVIDKLWSENISEADIILITSDFSARETVTIQI